MWGCSLEAERFNTQCSCLARNLECSSRCGCAQEGKCLNRAVSLRNALVLGKDVCEIDSWGMDCYTRRNIIDGTSFVCTWPYGRTSNMTQALTSLSTLLKGCAQNSAVND